MARRKLNTPFLLIVLGVIAAGVVVIGGLLFLKTRNDPTRYVKRGDMYMEKGEYKDAHGAYMRAIGKDPFNPKYYDLSIDALEKIVPDTQQDANDRYSTLIALYLEKGRTAKGIDPIDPLREAMVLNRATLEGVELMPGAGGTAVFERISNEFGDYADLPDDDADQAWLLNHVLESKWRFGGAMSDTDWDTAREELEAMVELDPGNAYNQYAVLRPMLDRAIDDLNAGKTASGQRQMKAFNRRLEQAKEAAGEAPEFDFLVFERDFYDWNRGRSDTRPDVERLKGIEAATLEIQERRRISEMMARLIRLGQAQHVGSMDRYGPQIRAELLNLRHRLAGELYERDPEDVRNVFLYVTSPNADDAAVRELVMGLLESEMSTVGINSRLRAQSQLRAARILFDRANASLSQARLDLVRFRESGVDNPTKDAELQAALDDGLDSLKAGYEMMVSVIDDSGDTNESLRLMAKFDLDYATDDWDGALQAVNQFLAAGGNLDSQRLLKAADVSMRAGDMGSANRFADRLIEIRPDLATDPAFAIIRARLAMGTGDYDRAGGIANAVIQVSKQVNTEESNKFAREAEGILETLKAVRSGRSLEDDPLNPIMAEVSRAKAEGDYERQKSILLEGLSMMRSERPQTDDEKAQNRQNIIRLLSALATLEISDVNGDPDSAQAYASQILEVDAENRLGKLVNQVAGMGPVETMASLAATMYPNDQADQREQFWMLVNNELLRMNRRLDQHNSDPGALTALELEELNTNLPLVEQAVEELEAEILSNPDRSVRARRYQVELLAREGKFDEARKVLSEIRELDGDNWRMVYMDARLHIMNDDPQSAIELLARSIEDGIANAKIYQLYGRELMRVGQNSEGLEALSIAHRDAPNDAMVALDLALALVRAGDARSALQVFRRSAGPGRGSQRYLDEWLALEEKVGQPRVALEERDRVWQLNPSNWGNGVAYATLLVDAPVRWDEYLDSKTGKPVYRELEWDRLPKQKRDAVIAEIRSSRADKSREIFEELIARPNVAPSVFVAYANSLESRGDRDSGIEVLTRAVQSEDATIGDAERAVIAVDIGRRYLEAADTDKADEWFEVARSIQPQDNPVAEKSLIMLYQERQDAERLAASLRSLLALTIDNPGAIDRSANLRLLIRALLDSGDTDEAENIFNEEFAGSDLLIDQLLAGTVYIAKARKAQINEEIEDAKTFLKTAEDQFVLAGEQAPGLLEPVLQRAIIHDLLYQWTDDPVELEAAIEFARAGNAKSKASWVAQELLVTLLMQAEQYDNAIGSLEGYLESQPDSDQARGLMLRIFQSRGNLDRAVEIAQEAVERNPYDIAWNARLGRMRADQGRYSDAAASFKRLFDMTNDTGLARVFVEMKLLRDPPDVDGVLAFARQQRNMFRSDPFMLGAYAATLAYAGQVDTALRVFEDSYKQLRNQNASEVEMQQFLTWLPRIATEIHEEEVALDKAEELIDDMSNGNPGTGARLVLAQAWLEKGPDAYPKVIEQLSTVAKGSNLEDIDLAPLVALGSLLYQTGECEQAVEIFTQALAKKPDDPSLLNNCAFVRANCNGDLDLARRESRQAVDLDPFNASFLDTLGFIQMRSGSYEEADRTLRKSVRRRKTTSNLMHLAELLVEQGDTEGASTLLREAGDLKPTATEQKTINDLIKRIAAVQEGEG